MTVVIDFTPNSVAPFQFNPTLDGRTYAARVVWNLFGQRYYLELSSLDGTLVFNQALVGSPVGYALQSISWARGTVTAVVAEPHGYKVGSTLELTVSGCVPAAYNGTWRCLITAPAEFTYPLRAYPGLTTTLGKVDYNVNLAGGYFTESTLVFREPSQQFEVSP